MPILTLPTGLSKWQIDKIQQMPVGYYFVYSRFL